MAGGIKFGDVKSELATVVANGVGGADARTMLRTNEATHQILDRIIPKGGMITADMVSVTDGSNGEVLLLPKEFENAIEEEVLDGTVNGGTDVRQGWYNIINQFTYVDPALQNDSPLVDLGLVPDPNNASILRRKYQFPGLAAASTVRVTGAKAYVPITSDDDYLIVQNVPALKMMILAIERYENNARDEAKGYRDDCMEALQAEVKKHILDPVNSQKRRANYESDLANYAAGSFAHARARLALEVPKLMQMGKSALTRLLWMAEMRLMEQGIWKGCLRELTATIVGGEILFPRDIEAILAADICGSPADVRSIFFAYQKNGPGWCGFCPGSFRDMGEVYFDQTGYRRRKFGFNGSATDNVELTAVGKVRWVQRAPGDELVIKNFEALRLMAQAVLNERDEKWQDAAVAQGNAVAVLEKEMREYLGGIQHVMHFDPAGFGMSDLGQVL